MKAKEFLNQPRKLDVLITNKLIEIEQWKAIALSSTAQQTGERVQSSGSQQKMADAIDRYVDYENELNRQIDELIDTKRDVLAVIEQLETIEYDVLHKIYVQFLTFSDVADLYDRSYSNITTIHGRALKNVQVLLDGRKKDDKQRKHTTRTGV